jgi:hypothetical protein
MKDILSVPDWDIKIISMYLQDRTALNESLDNTTEGAG